MFLAGDLNRSPKEADKLAVKLNLHVVPPTSDDPEGFTRKSARLDYVLSSQLPTSDGPAVVALKDIELSDHLPIVTTI